MYDLMKSRGLHGYRSRSLPCSALLDISLATVPCASLWDADAGTESQIRSPDPIESAPPIAYKDGAYVQVPARYWKAGLTWKLDDSRGAI